MKRIAIILLAFSTGAAFAALWGYDYKNPPPMTLPDAYILATSALGKETNNFHCVKAHFIGAGCNPGAWYFEFWNKTGAVKTVYASKACPAVVTDGYPDF